jgi:hypothetical protein
MGSIDLSMEGTVGLTAVLFCFAFLATGGTLAAGAWVAVPLIRGRARSDCICTQPDTSSLANALTGYFLEVR